jgi:hypothetical protein
MADHGAVGEAVATLALVDHHVHQALGSDVPRAAFEEQITESDRPPPPGTTQFDSQLGFAIRRWCAPVLGLPPSAPAEEYLARRAELGPEQATGLLLRATGVACFLIDTGYVLDTMLSLPEMAAASGAEAAAATRCGCAASWSGASRAGCRSCCCTATRSTATPPPWPRPTRTCIWTWA